MSDEFHTQISTVRTFMLVDEMDAMIMLVKAEQAGQVGVSLRESSLDSVTPALASEIGCIFAEAGAFARTQR